MAEGARRGTCRIGMLLKATTPAARFRVSDIIDLPLLKLFFVAINALVWTAKDVLSWRAKSEILAMPENNQRLFCGFVGSMPGTDDETYWIARTPAGQCRDAVAGSFAALPPQCCGYFGCPEESDGPPFSATESAHRWRWNRRRLQGDTRAYAVVANLCDGMGKKVTISGKTKLTQWSADDDPEVPFPDVSTCLTWRGRERARHFTSTGTATSSGNCVAQVLGHVLLQRAGNGCGSRQSRRQSEHRWHVQ